MASKEELSREKPEKASEGFERVAEENEENLEMKSDENSTGSTAGSGQCSPRGVFDIPIYGVHSDGGSNSESSSSERSTDPDGSLLESHNSQRRSLLSGLLLRKNMSIRRLSTFPPSSWRSASERKNSESFRSCKDQSRIELAQQEIPMKRPTWRNFDYQELVVATNNFSHENLIGKGGHAEVYKGCLRDGQLVAVKRLSKKDKEDERIGYFLSELGIIAHVDHANAAQLLGFSVEGGLHMVLQFSPHGSLASILHGSKEGLKWKIRFNIALKIAEGLCYLHEGCQRRIIHRDIKASNILLTEDYQPQISDFGLAKWLPDKWTHHFVFPIEGTFGYMAPEYFMHGVVNEKTDVFAYGVLLLELITGMRAVDSSRKSLVMWAKPFLDANDFNGLADPSFGDDSDPEELKLLVSVASMCIHHISTSRPNMNTVVQLIRGEVGTQELMGRDSMPRPPLFDACDLQDYTCSSYLTDLHRHKQIALEQ